MIKKQYIIENLNCVNCAAKMEKNIKNIVGIENVSLNFVNKSLSFEMSESNDYEKTFLDILNIMKNIESEVELNEKPSNYDIEIKTDKGKKVIDKAIVKYAVSVSLFIIALLLKKKSSVSILFFIVSFIISGYDVVRKAIRNIFKGQFFDENFLMTIATIGAFSIKQYSEGAAVMIFYELGELLQNAAVEKSRKSISSLMNIRPDYANVVRNYEIIKVSPLSVKIGDIVVVEPGEKIPLDGLVEFGSTSVDTSALTGESIPKDIKEGEEVLAGYINKSGLIKIKVMKEFEESTVSKILNLTQNAIGRKSPIENFITKFARYYTPIVTFSALGLAIIPPIFINGASFSTWIYRALIFLVVSCPCALVLSIPIGFFGGIGGASRKGILVKGGNYLEGLSNVDTIIFDKTGTITKGIFKVTDIRTISEISKDELLKYAALAESHSNHPIAKSITNAWNKDLEQNSISKYEEIAGYGINAIIDGKKVSVGNQRLMEKEKIVFKTINDFGTIVHVSIDDVYMGYLIISDELKDDTKIAIAKLKNMGIKNMVVLTGDNKISAEKIANEAGIGTVYSGLLPDGKVSILEEIEKNKKTNGKIVFVGDGINDAPVLARADIGIAMGALGSDAAIEAADVVLMTDELSKIASAINISKRTKKIVLQNIIFALSIKFIVLILGAFGEATMWEAVFADVGVALIAVLNSLRTLKIKDI